MRKMVLAASQKWPFVINLGNSIIGVAILAMPFCFKQCGILLGMLVLLFCTWLTLASCQLLVKAGIMSHYQSYEYLAYYTYGPAAKFLVEMGMIGMQLGTLVAQIVVIGDLGPPIISHLFGVENSWRNRMYLIIILCLFVGLPLGLMKDLRNVSRASTVCIMFYAVFIVYSLWLSSGNVLKGEWFAHVNWWRPQGFFQCLPIMSFSFGCQTQLFILYDALPEPSLQAIKGIIHSAVNLCAISYMLVGFFGYVTFYHLDIPGDIITVFPGTLGTHLIKLGFVMSIAITFPVIIYPCRASLYTLLFQKKSKHSDLMSGTYIPEHLFKGITVTIVMGSMITGILIPNVEFVLGLNGAITGTLICYIFPALFFLRVSKPEGKTIAQIVLALGIGILLISTFTTLYANDQSHAAEEVKKAVQEAANRAKGLDNVPADHVDSKMDRNPVLQPPKGDENANPGNSKRLEPPNPFAPADNVKVDKDAKQNEKPAGGNQPAQKEAAAAQKSVKEEKVKVAVREVKEGVKEGRQVQEQVRGALAAQPHREEQQQKGPQGQQQEQPPKQKAAAPVQQDGAKVDQKKENQPQVVAQGQNAANPPLGGAQAGQGVVHQAIPQGQDAAKGLPAGGQGQNNVNLPQGVAQNQNVANQAVAQGGVNPPQVGAQGQGGRKPAQGVAQQGAQPQGAGQALQPQGAAQQAQAKPAAGLGQAALAAQEDSLRQGQGVPAQQQAAAAVQPDKAVQGQPHREILANGGLVTQQPVLVQQGQGRVQGQKQPQKGN